MKTVAIVGGGIAGLSIARAIARRAPDVQVSVLERSARPGGNIRSERVDGYLCEWGPDGFLDNAPATLALASDVGLEPALRPSSDAARRRFIFRHGRLIEVPASPGAFLTTPLVSWGAKARILYEPLARSRPEGDETIFDFAARRIGREAAAAMIDPMVSGIFAGDARALSLRACFPRMWQLETDHGGLFKALIATRQRRKKDDAVGAPAGRLTSFGDGMEALIHALARALGHSLHTCTPIQAIRQGRESQPLHGGSAGRGFTLISPGLRGIEADAVVLAGPALESAEIVRGFDQGLSSMLAGIPTASLAVVCLGYDARALDAERGPLNGFGFLVPRSEGVRILGALWETSIYPRRAPDGKALLRVMIGGALDPDAVSLDDEALLGVVRHDLKSTMGLGIAPEFVRIIRHRRGIPQYTVGHLDRLRQIEARLQAHPGLWLAGNSYRGVAINSCVAEADGIASCVVDYVASSGGLRAVS